MILCPSCNTKMTNEESQLMCPLCNKTINHKNGMITNLLNISLEEHSGMSPIGLDNCYKIEQEHFWYKYRRKIILYYFNKYISKNKEILEIGAGTGNISRQLMKDGYNNISVGEIHENGLRYAMTYGIENLYQFDITNSPFQNHFDAVGMFDVLEHINDDSLAIQNISKMLKNNGYFILTVPAHKWLWCREDQIAFHKKRYEINELLLLLKNNGFDIVLSKTLFVFILPLLFLRKLLHPASDNDVHKAEIEGYNFALNPIINKILFGIMLVENFIFNKLFNISTSVGGSLMVIAKKTGVRE